PLHSNLLPYPTPFRSTHAFHYLPHQIPYNQDKLAIPLNLLSQIFSFPSSFPHFVLDSFSITREKCKDNRQFLEKIKFWTFKQSVWESLYFLDFPDVLDRKSVV